MTGRLAITTLLATAAALAIAVIGAILDWSNGAVGVAMLATVLIIGLAREPNDRARSSH
jgi:hypothetical protein